MSKTLQNFYKATITLDWTIGTGNFYVSTKPTTSDGWLVVSPNNTSTREIVAYNATGTDSNGDYITITARGVGGTSEQIHSIGEPIRMNVTAEYWADMQTDIDDIIAAGAPNANESTKGVFEEATDAEVTAGTATGGTGAKLSITPAKLLTYLRTNNGQNQILTTTASQDLTAGQAVGVSLLSTGVAKALQSSSLASCDVATGQTLTQTQMVITPISGDKFIVIYEITNTTLRAVVATVNRSTMAVSLGTAVSLTTDSYKIENGTVDACTIDIDKFVVSYISSADTTISKAVVCTVSGTTITVGTPQTIKDYASGVMSVTALCKLDTNKFAYHNNTGGANQEVFACTVSGTVITVGTAVACGANIADAVMLAQLDTNKFVAYSVGEYVQVYTVSGTTITAGTQQSIALSGGDGVWGKYDIVSHTTNAFVVKAGNYYKACTVSGTVVTAGTEVADSGDYGFLRVVDSTNVTAWGNNATVITNLAISGTTITATTKVGDKMEFASGPHASRHGLFTTGNSYFVIAYPNTDSVRFFIEGQSIQFLGFVKSSVSRGASVDVVVRGKDSNQSGLTQGETYAVGAGGTLAIQSASVANETQYTANLVKAISATEIIF